MSAEVQDNLVSSPQPCEKTVEKREQRRSSGERAVVGDALCTTHKDADS